MNQFERMNQRLEGRFKMSLRDAIRHIANEREINKESMFMFNI